MSLEAFNSFVKLSKRKLYDYPFPTLTVVSYGGGVNSAGLVSGLVERGIPPDRLLFADTGGEFERVYQHIQEMNSWLESKGFPKIETIRYDSKHGTLEQECLNNKTLPSLAFGFKGCSVKWKRQPMDRVLKQWDRAKRIWKDGGKVIRLMGIDAGEAHRGKVPDDEKFLYRKPLIDWDWDREDCVEAIKRMGAPMPGKSACWFCPASKKNEVLWLAKNRPELFQRCVEMEENAHLTTVKGLGRSYSWKELIQKTSEEQRTVRDTIEISCSCYDGGEGEGAAS